MPIPPLGGQNCTPDDKKERRPVLLATEARLRARAARCPSLRTHTAHEVGHRLADLIGAILLDEVAAHHHHFGLVRCVDKELRDVGLGAKRTYAAASP